MKKVFPLLVLLAASVSLAASNTTNQKVIPQPPTTLSCVTGGTAEYSPGAEVVRYDIWNSQTNSDVCVCFCGASGCGGACDSGTKSNCSFILGTYAGSGTPDVWTVSPTLDADTANSNSSTSTKAAFRCDGVSQNSTIVITEWHRIR